MPATALQHRSATLRAPEAPIARRPAHGNSFQIPAKLLIDSHDSKAVQKRPMYWRSTRMITRMVRYSLDCEPECSPGRATATKRLRNMGQICGHTHEAQPGIAQASASGPAGQPARGKNHTVRINRRMPRGAKLRARHVDVAQGVLEEVGLLRGAVVALRCAPVIVPDALDVLVDRQELLQNPLLLAPGVGLILLLPAVRNDLGHSGLSKETAYMTRQSMGIRESHS